ncbi:MAG: hypothetical protein F6K31_07230 [Symploca sp. SIO2G7]|nr:hypothetical protein [Symploca sp. SIO2G7]
MNRQQRWQKTLEKAGVPVNQAAAAAGQEARQALGELTVPLPEGRKELEAVQDARTWLIAKRQQSNPTEKQEG